MTDHSGQMPLAQRIERAQVQLAAISAELGNHVFGQERVIEQTLCCLLSGGHALLVGVPGLAKTRLVSCLAVALGLPSNRIQFTPDLMPFDILGSEVLEMAEDGRRSFRFLQGPIFANLILADEINRASPRTQSALLQAMQENCVTIAGKTFALPQPFHVLATQNPLEQEGAYPLPEAQLDRFLLQIDVPLPDRETERKILVETTIGVAATPKSVLGDGELAGLQAVVRELPVGEQIVQAILDLVRGLRPDDTGQKLAREKLAWGPGPRAGQALMLATRARALLRGRISPSLDDIQALARATLVHRCALTFSARAQGHTVQEVIDAVLADQF